MLNRITKAYLNGLNLWTGVITRYAMWVVIISVFLSLCAVIYVFQNVRINTDTGDMLSSDLEFRRHSAEISKAFPQFSDNLVIVIDGKTADVADDAARELADYLSAHPKLFGRVIDTAGSKFFRRNGLLYLDLDEIYQISDSLADAQPLLSALWHDRSIVGFLSILSLAIDESLKKEKAQPIEISNVLEAMNKVARAQVHGEWGDLSWRELMMGPVNPDDEIDYRRRILLIQPPLNFSSLSPAYTAMKGIRNAVHHLGLTHINGVRVRLTGSAALSHEELESVKEGMGIAGIVSLILVIGLLGLGLRSKWLVFATIMTLLIGLIWTAGFAILVLGTLNLISVAFAVLFIGLSVDFGIHYGLRYQEEVKAGFNHKEALSRTAKNLGGTLTLCAFSAAISFFSFLLTEYRGLAELGLIAGTGMFVALFSNITVLPAILTILPFDRNIIKKVEFSSSSIVPSFTRQYSRIICIIGLVIGVASTMALPNAEFDFDPMNLRDPSKESVATILDLMKDNQSSPYSVTILAKDLIEAQQLAVKLEKLDLVDSVKTIADYVPVDQQEKLQIISNIGLFLGPSFVQTSAIKTYTQVDREISIKNFINKLKVLSSQFETSLDGQAAGKLHKSIYDLFKVQNSDYDAVGAKIVEFETRLLRALPGQLDAINQALKAELITLDNLPREIRESQISLDGRVKLEVYPKEDLRNRKSLARFVAAIRTISVRASGSSVVILEAGNTVVKAFWQAGAISLIIIFMLLLFVLRQFLNAILVFIPLALAALLTVAISVLFGLPFNFANVIVLPLLFGIGVAGGIHLVMREKEKGYEAFKTSTPRAILFSALTTIGSFGSIAISAHPGTSSMGILLTISIILSLCCTLIFLPALMVVVEKTFEVDQ